MRWFNGNVADAIALSKSRKAIFVVFVDGTDDASQSFLSAIDTAEVSSKLQSNMFVAIKLDSATESYRQFAQIYQVVPVPSLFFIGRDGRPVEIVAGASSSSEILKRIDSVLAKTTEAPTDGSVPMQESAASTSSSTPHSEEPVPEVKVPEKNLDQENNTHQLSTSEGESEADVKNKVEEAKALIESSRIKKLEEDKAKEREKEVERRKVGQDIQHLRRWQQDQEYKQLKEEREREKREEAAARERVRNQIAQDRAERANRQMQVPEKKEVVEATENVTKRVSRSDTARLQLRLPDGASVTHQLSSTATLGELRAYVSERLSQSPSTFTLSTTFPRRVLAPDEDSRTMTDLELVPTAVLLVLPASSGGVVRSAGSASSAITPITQLFWALLAPILSIFTYVKNLVFGQGGASTSGTSTNSSGNQRLAAESRAQGPTRRVPATSEVRRQGNSNIHRLAQPQDSSDDDNNTWNGNSTQQM